LFEIRKNLDLRKILGVTKIFLKSRFHCIQNEENLINPSNIFEESYFNSTRALVKLGWKVKMGGLENQGGSEGLGNGNSLFSYGKKKQFTKQSCILS